MTETYVVDNNMQMIKCYAMVLLLCSFTLIPHIAAAGDLKQFKLGGTIQVDAVYVDDDKSELIPGSGTEIRRARFYIAGQHEKTWQYKLRVGFEEDDLSVKDAYLKHKIAGIKLGLFKPSFSIDEMTSSKFITFMERALPNAFKPGRRIGVGYHSYTNRFNLNFGLFGQGSADGDNGDEGVGVNTRITSPVVFRKNSLLHLGFNLTAEKPEDDINNSISFDSRPESHITGNIVDTGIIPNIETIVRTGVEISSVMQSLSIQAEFIMVDLLKNNASNNLRFNGSYIYASWFVTGEQRPYKPEHGVFGRIKPMTERGAWELALRYSDIDLNDDVINGGKASNMTFGVNWYSSLNTRFSMNYINVNTEDSNIFGNPDIMQFRAQIDF